MEDKDNNEDKDILTKKSWRYTYLNSNPEI